MSTERLNSILDKCRIMVYNASDPFIAEALLPYGYTPERLQNGIALYNMAKESHQTQRKEYTDQYYATATFAKEYERVRRAFANHVKIARIALNGNIEGQRLLPHSKKIQAYNEFIVKATAFYTVIKETPELSDLMNTYGITGNQLDIAVTNLRNLEEIKKKQFVETSEAQATTGIRNHHFDQLRAFCSALRTVARIALADQPQQLEKLGIMARNSAPWKSER